MPRICLAMIVKNEAHIIESCLKAVRPYVDSWCIVDTGSSDGTQELVRKVMDDLPGELHERPWRSFRHNRQECYELAQIHGDMILVLDADDTWEPSDGFAWPEQPAASYLVEIRQGSTRWKRHQVLSSAAAFGWHYEDPVHAIPVATRAGPSVELTGVRIVSRTTGRRHLDDPVGKYLRDAAIYERELRSEPSNTRYVFNLAQSYRDGKRLDRAVETYLQRVAMGGWREEVWYSLLQAALCLESLHRPEEATLLLMQAYEKCPGRVESLVHLARMQRLHSNHALAYTFASVAVEITAPPPGDILYVDEAAYAWRALDEHALAAFHTGRFAEALVETEQLLRIAPESERERLEANLEHSRAQVGTNGESHGRLLVAACGRSGTAYIAKLLELAGVRSGHERVFGLRTPAVPVWGDRQADASFLCLPWLSGLSHPILHLVRNPLDNCRSWLGVGMFADRPDPRHRPYIEAVRRAAPLVMAEPTPLRRWMAYWVVWNEAIELVAQERFRIEDIDRDPQPFASAVNKALPCPDDEGPSLLERVLEAASSVPKNLNTRRIDESVQWDDLLKCESPYLERFLELCKRYGYDERAARAVG